MFLLSISQLKNKLFRSQCFDLMSNATLVFTNIHAPLIGGVARHSRCNCFAKHFRCTVIIQQFMQKIREPECLSNSKRRKHTIAKCECFIAQKIRKRNVRETSIYHENVPCAIQNTTKIMQLSFHVFVSIGFRKIGVVCFTTNRKNSPTPLASDKLLPSVTLSILFTG